MGSIKDCFYFLCFRCISKGFLVDWYWGILYPLTLNYRLAGTSAARLPRSVVRTQRWNATNLKLWNNHFCSNKKSTCPLFMPFEYGLRMFALKCVVQRQKSKSTCFHLQSGGPRWSYLSWVQNIKYEWQCLNSSPSRTCFQFTFNSTFSWVLTRWGWPIAIKLYLCG